MNIRTWIKQDAWRGLYFKPTLLGDEFEIFRSGASFPLVTSLVDGCQSEPNWAREPAEAPTDALFASLKPIVARLGASWFYVTDPDNALSLLEWEEEINPDSFNSLILQEFETNRAVEGGTSYMCIAFHDRSGLIVFRLDNYFRICFYGSNHRKKDLQKALSRDA